MEKGGGKEMNKERKMKKESRILREMRSDAGEIRDE